MKTIGNTPITYLTKRELFAAMAMQGIMSRRRIDIVDYNNNIQWSIKYADELIKQLNTKTESDEGNEV